MALTVTPREQHQFISALNKLGTSERVHKGNLNTINKTLDKIDKIENKQEFLSKLKYKMQSNFSIDDSTNVKSFIDSVKGKLEKQNSNMYDKKLSQINNIGDRLFQTSQKLEAEKHSNQIEKLTSSGKQIFREVETGKSQIHEIIDQRKEDLERIAVYENKLSRITPAEVSEDRANRIQKIDREATNEISTLNTDLEKISNRKKGLISFLEKNGKQDVIKDLEKAKTNKFLAERMRTTEYAKQKFGTTIIKEAGTHEWSNLREREVLTKNGEIYLNRFKKYQDTKRDITITQQKISQIEFKRDAQIKAIQSEEISPLQLKQQSKIDKYNNSYNQKGVIGNQILTDIKEKINILGENVEQSKVLQKAIEQIADDRAAPEMKELATRHDENITKLAEKKVKLESSYNQLLDAIKTNENYFSDVDIDSESDYETYI